MLVIFACIGCGASEKRTAVPHEEGGGEMDRLLKKAHSMPAAGASALPSGTEATAGAPPAPTPPFSSDTTGKPPTTSPAPPSVAKPTVTAAESPPTKSEAPPPQKTMAVQVAEAELDFESAQDAFSAAGNECASLCKALASMKRATEHLCELTQGGGSNDQKRCTDAKAKLESAQAKVKAACGGC
jgi:hypothetical protein